MMDDWVSLCGYNEKIWGWGGDDNDMWNRARKKFRMSENSLYPLYHINHDKRRVFLFRENCIKIQL
jgi:predicted glycosyltransferase involved in capsule biosynthesis